MDEENVIAKVAVALETCKYMFKHKIPMVIYISACIHKDS